MNHFCSAIVILAAISAFAQTDCMPGKDYRSHKNGGIEVADFAISGTRTVDSTELATIVGNIVGSRFDETGTKLEEHVYKLFYELGYLSVQIERLRIKPVVPRAVPTPVNVEAQVTEGRRCPSYAEPKALLQFLIAHRSHSLDADPKCVMRAFATLRHDRSYTKALVQLLGFERSDEHDNSLRGLGSRYPATSALDFPSAVPHLIEAIKQSESELVRTNAASTVHLIYQSCVQAAVARLKTEAKKAGTTNEEKERLEAAVKYMNELYGGPGPCKSIHGAPTTLVLMQRELDESEDLPMTK